MSRAAGTRPFVGSIDRARTGSTEVTRAPGRAPSVWADSELAYLADGDGARRSQLAWRFGFSTERHCGPAALRGISACAYSASNCHCDD